MYRIGLNYAKNIQDAEDIVQNTLMKLYLSEIEFSDEEHLKSWLIRVCINESKNLVKSGWRKKTCSITELENTLFNENQEYRELYDCVLKLPEKYSIVIYLHYYEGYKTEEIATITDTKPSTVRTRLERARNLLKQMYKEE